MFARGAQFGTSAPQGLMTASGGAAESLRKPFIAVVSKPKELSLSLFPFVVYGTCL